MWCSDCRQDVPGVASPQNPQAVVCARCGEPFSRTEPAKSASSLTLATTELARQESKVRDVLQRSLLDFDVDWKLDDDLDIAEETVDSVTAMLTNTSSRPWMVLPPTPELPPEPEPAVEPKQEGSSPAEPVTSELDTPTPILDTPTTIPDTPTPIQDTPTPIQDAPTPIQDAPTPIQDTPTPILDTLTPIQDTPTPILDTPSPILDTPKSINEPELTFAPEPTPNPIPTLGRESTPELEIPLGTPALTVSLPVSERGPLIEPAPLRDQGSAPTGRPLAANMPLSGMGRPSTMPEPAVRAPLAFAELPDRHAVGATKYNRYTDHGIHSPSSKTLTPLRGKRREPSFVGRTFVALGLAGFACGSVLIGWSLVAERPDLWTMGIPSFLLGQAALLIGMIFQMEGLWQNDHTTRDSLDEIDGRLAELNEPNHVSSHLPHVHVGTTRSSVVHAGHTSSLASRFRPHLKPAEAESLSS